jgi:hypothetical protein
MSGWIPVIRYAGAHPVSRLVNIGSIFCLDYDKWDCGQRVGSLPVQASQPCLPTLASEGVAADRRRTPSLCFLQVF